MLRYIRHAFIWVERALCHFEHDAVALDRFTLTAIAVAGLAIILAFSGRASDAILLIAFAFAVVFIVATTRSRRLKHTPNHRL